MTVFFGFRIEFGSDFFFGFFDGFANFFDVGFVFTMDAVHSFYDKEEDPSDNEELETGLEEFTVGNGGGVIGAEEVRNADGEVVEIDAAGD